jgi:hypothetical protein
VDERPLDAGPFDPTATPSAPAAEQAAPGYQPPPAWGPPPDQPTWGPTPSQPPPAWGPTPSQPPPAWGPTPSQPAGWSQQPPGWGQPAGWSPTAPAGWYQTAPNNSYLPPSLDGCSVAGLVFGILPTVPLGLIFGITGIVRTSHRVRRGRPLAVTGLLLSVLWLVLFVAIGAASRPDSGQPGAAQQSPAATATVPSPASTGAVSPRNLRPGDCFMVKLGVVLTSIPLLPCSQPHDAQIFANLRIPNSSYPGSSAKTLDAALKLCEPAAYTYMNGRIDLLEIAAYYPSSAIWAMGDHTAHCVLYDARQKFVGDVRDHH